MDNKNTALNQSVDLISTKGLDEMQREQAYRIAFNCFKAFYWGNVTLAGLLSIGAVLLDENTTLAYACAIIGIVFTLFASVIYVIFAAKTSKLGAMNPQFLKVASSPQKIITMTILGLGYVIISINNMDNRGFLAILLAGFMTTLYVSHIITYYMARKSLKSMNEEAEE